jgi:putative transposase
MARANKENQQKIIGFTYEMFPTEEQKKLLSNNLINPQRGVYNLLVKQITTNPDGTQKEWKEIWEYGKYVKKEDVDAIRSQNPWIENYPLTYVFWAAIERIEKSLDSFGKYKNTKSKPPTFKKAFGKQSVFTQNATIKCIKFNWDENTISNFLPKNFKEHSIIPIEFQKRKYPGAKLKSLSIKKFASGRFFLSGTFELPEPKEIVIKQEVTDILGIDVGLKDFIITSNGRKYNLDTDEIKHLNKLGDNIAKAISNKQTRIKKLNDNKLVKSKNYLTALERKARYSERITFLREKQIEFIVNDLIKQSKYIAVESLNVKGLIRSKMNFTRKLNNIGLGEFFNLLEQKLNDVGGSLTKIDRFFPSSKMCSECGTKNTELKLSDRTWTCACGAEHDRDINAAINIKNEGLKNMKQNLVVSE